MAFNANGEGPYGFSFELSRTSAGPAESIDPGAESIPRGHARWGRAITVAAPAPISPAKLRREIDFRFFISKPSAGEVACIMPLPGGRSNHLPTAQTLSADARPFLL